MRLAVWPPVARSSPSGDQTSTPPWPYPPGRQVRVQLEQDPLACRGASEAHRVVDARAAAGSARGASDRQRHHVGEVGDHRRGGGTARHPSPQREVGVRRGRRRGGADRISMFRTTFAAAARMAAGSGSWNAGASSGAGTDGNALEGLLDPARLAVGGGAERAEDLAAVHPRVTRTCAALLPSASTSVVQSNRSPSLVSPEMNCTVVQSAGRPVSTSASATATPIAVPPNSLPSKRASSWVSSKVACPARCAGGRTARGRASGRARRS